MVGLKGKDKEVLSGLKTESRNPRTLDLDLMSVGELLTVMNEEDKNVIEAVKQALPQIQETVEAVICALNKGGEADLRRSRNQRKAGDPGRGGVPAHIFHHGRGGGDHGRR